MNIEIVPTATAQPTGQSVAPIPVVLPPTPSLRELLRLEFPGMITGFSFAGATIWIIGCGYTYTNEGEDPATAVSVITGFFYPTTGILFNFANAITLMAPGEGISENRTLEIRLASHIVGVVLGLAQNGLLLTFVYAAGSALYGNDVNAILTDYLFYNFATQILLLLNGADIQCSFLLPEKYSIFVRELTGMITGASLYAALVSKQFIGDYFLPAVDTTQQLTALVTNSLWLRYAYQHFYRYSGREQVLKDIKAYLKLGLPSTLIAAGVYSCDITNILFLSRYSDFLPGFQVAMLMSLPLIIIQGTFEAKIVQMVEKFGAHPRQILLSCLLLAFMPPLMLSLILAPSYQAIAGLIAGDDNPALISAVEDVLPYVLVGSFVDNIRSTLTAMLRGYKDQNIPATINILVTWSLVITAIGAVLGDAPLAMINLFRNILAPLFVAAILGKRLYHYCDAKAEPVDAASVQPLRSLSIFRSFELPPVDSVARAESGDPLSCQHAPAFVSTQTQ